MSCRQFGARRIEFALGIPRRMSRWLFSFRAAFE